jgi:hypothetical protein
LKVEIEAGGRLRTVSVEGRGDEWTVTVDGRTVAATVKEVGGRWSLLIGPPQGARPGGSVDRQATTPGPAEAGRDEREQGGDDVESGFSRIAGSGPEGGRTESGFRRIDQSGPGGGNAKSGVNRIDGRAIRPWRSYEIAFSASGDVGIVFVDGIPVPVGVSDPRARYRRGSRDSVATAGGPRAIVSPMPGRVVKVLVERGQAVAARQPVVVVEAMKMENELRAPRAGIVAAVHAVEGMSVDAHAVLVVLE